MILRTRPKSRLQEWRNDGARNGISLSGLLRILGPAQTAPLQRALRDNKGHLGTSRVHGRRSVRPGVL